MPKPWTPEEDEVLIQRYQRYQENETGLDWEEISDHLPDRKAAACKARIYRLPSRPDSKRPNAWTPEEDEVLVQRYQRYQENEIELDWEEISDRLPGRNSGACEKRLYRILPSHANVSKKVPEFTTEEVQEIVRLREEEYLEWEAISRKFGRSPQTIQIRYTKHLKNKNATLGEEIWTSEEDEQLLHEGHARSERKHHEWDRIAELLPGRTSKNCKNRFYYLKSRKPGDKQLTPESSQRPADSDRGREMTRGKIPREEWSRSPPGPNEADPGNESFSEWSNRGHELGLKDDVIAFRWTFAGGDLPEGS